MFLWRQNRQNSFIKNVFESFLSKCGTLHVDVALVLLGEPLTFLQRDGFLAFLLHFGDRLRVVPQIHLGPDENDGHFGRVVMQLGQPALDDVL